MTIWVTGSNIMILSGLFAGLAGRLLSRRRATWVAVAGVVIHTILIGASAAVLRAAFMGGLYLLAQYLSRETYAPASLAASAFIMTVDDPYVLWDAGFQLSFAATIGLVLYTKPLKEAFERGLARFTSAEQARKIVGSISEFLLVTLAAQIITMPLLPKLLRAAVFGRLQSSLISSRVVPTLWRVCSVVPSVATPELPPMRQPDAIAARL